MTAHMEEIYMRALGRNFLRIAIVFLLCQLIVACSTPEKVVTEISNTLGPKCKTRFTDDRMGKYSYAAQAGWGGAVFALAKEGGREACGHGSGFNRDPNDHWGTQYESVALRSCEYERGLMNISNPCRVYARNFNVIWNEALYESESQERKKREAESLSKKVEEIKANTQKNIEVQSVVEREVTPTNTSPPLIDRLSIEASKKKCIELGFKPATEGYGKCVLQLSK